MKLLVEDYAYTNASVKKYLKSDGCCLDTKSIGDGYKVLNVGYIYAPDFNDCVFVLPKVILKDGEDDNNKGATIFGVSPDDIFDFNLAVSKNESLKKQQDFLATFAFWIYQTIRVFKKLNPESKIIADKNTYSILDKTKHKVGANLPDIILSLLKFNEDNRQLLTFTIQSNHSGQNKINWKKTISESTAFIKENVPLYLSPTTHKKQINFEEELIIVFYSILNYISKTFNKKVEINNNFELIKGKAFLYMLNHSGMQYMRSIKYKYFSDKMVLLWTLCYAFFKKAQEVNSSSQKQDYLLVSDFEVVFEEMIDELIGNNDLPKGLKVQSDDKRIDHLYTYKYLIENLDNTTFGLEREIYNIADSKYYRRDKKLVGHDVPKQFTYARNVIQWHMDLLHDLLEKDVERAQKYNDINLFDKVTESYNIIPNFFISGFVDELKYENDGFQPSKLGKGEDDYIRQSWIFWERLFDRNTYFTLHYDVNFLYVLKMYAQDKKSAKQAWKIKMRERFRKGILDFIKDEFVFYQIIVPFDDKAEKPENDKQIKTFVNKYFRQLLGKVFCFNDADGNRVLLYAERKDQEKGNGKSFEYKEDECTHIKDGCLCIPTSNGIDKYKVHTIDKLGESKYQNTNKYALVGYIKSDAHFNI